jgi:two-component system response regulator FixJ
MASCFGKAEDFIENVESLRPAPILLDVKMPDIDGLELMNVLKDRAYRWPIIVMTGHGDVPLAVSAMKLGAVEFLEKPFKVDALEHALDLAYGTLHDLLEDDRRRDLAHMRFAGLTPRERQIALRLAGGSSNKAVAVRLDLSVRTVEMHRAHAMKKLGVANILELVEVLAALPDLPSRDDDG